MSTEPTKPGSYRFTDHSVLRPWVTQVWFSRLFKLLPPWLAANLVTLISTGTLAAVIAGSLYADSLGPMWLALLQFGALQLYVAGDHLDGMQAKASGTMSPLGDFLDHHADLWAGCVLIFGFWSMMGTAPLWSLYALTVVLICAFSITYVERAERKALHFTAWGTLEAIAILSAFYLSWAIPAVRSWWLRELTAGVPRHMLIAGLGALMALGAIVVIALRLKRLPLPFLLNTAAMIAMAAWFENVRVPPLWGWFIVVLTGADYTARVMQAHTTTRSRPWPDFVAPIAAVLLYVVPLGHEIRLALTVITAWLVVRYSITLARIVYGWRDQWVWVNSPGGKAP